jgi:hypothetical protein
VLRGPRVAFNDNNINWGRCGPQALTPTLSQREREQKKHPEKKSDGGCGKKLIRIEICQLLAYEREVSESKVFKLIFDVG